LRRFAKIGERAASISGVISPTESIGTGDACIDVAGKSGFLGISFRNVDEYRHSANNSVVDTGRAWRRVQPEHPFQQMLHVNIVGFSG
jgi:hypothetical protein